MDSMKPVRVTIDEDDDLAYVYLTEIEDGEASRQVTIDVPGNPERGLVLDFDEFGTLLGIECLGVGTLPGSLRGSDG